MSQRGQWAFRHELRDSRARDLDAWLRQAKVEELGPRLGQHDVAGLQVSVNDSGLVRGREGVRVELRSRNNKELTKAYPAVAARGLKLQAKSVVLDGEVVALGASGRPSFQALQHRSAHLNHVIVYYVFDLLHLDGHDFTSRPLVERQAKLGRVVRGSGLLLSETLEGTPHDVVAAVRSLGLEGIIAKRNDSRYISGERSSAGQKLKLDRQREFVIGAYRPGGNGMNALLVGYYEGRQLRFAGKVRAGFTPHLRRQVFAQLEPLHTSKCPFVDLANAKTSHWGGGITPEQMAEITWVRPTLVAQVRFLEWTAEGHLRHATFLGCRATRRLRRSVASSERTTPLSLPTTRTWFRASPIPRIHARNESSAAQLQCASLPG